MHADILIHFQSRKGKVLHAVEFFNLKIQTKL